MKYINAYTKLACDNPNGGKELRAGPALFGENAVVYSSGLHKEFILYSDIAWVFVFDQEFQSKVMGRVMSKGVDYLMLISHGSETAFIPIRKHAYSALELMKQYVPTANFGYTDELQERFFSENEENFYLE